MLCSPDAVLKGLQKQRSPKRSLRDRILNTHPVGGPQEGGKGGAGTADRGARQRGDTHKVWNRLSVAEYSNRNVALTGYIMVTITDTLTLALTVPLTEDAAGECCEWPGLTKPSWGTPWHTKPWRRFCGTVVCHDGPESSRAYRSAAGCNEDAAQFLVPEMPGT